jgi:hypothetical protein
MTRSFKYLVAASAVALGASLTAQSSAPEIAYDATEFLNLPGSVGFIGEVAGVATNSRGNVFVYTRTGHPYATLGDSRTFYHAGSRLFQFDATGKFVRELGQDLYGFNAAQNVRVDPSDNIWTLDAGANQVVKFDANGNVQLVLGRKPETISVRAGGGLGGGGGAGRGAAPGAAPAGRGGAAPEGRGGAAPAGEPAGRGAGRGAGGGGGRGGAGGGAAAGGGAPAAAAPAAAAGAAQAGRGGGPGGAAGAPGGGGRGPGAGAEGSAFSRPSDVTWDRAGNIFIADGVGSNNRIAKFDKDGKFLKSWGQTGSGQGQFNGVRGIATDAQGNIYVADSGNNRIQVFDGEGTFKSEITNIGTPQAICVSRGATQYIYSAHSGDPDGMVDAAIYKIGLDGKVIGKLGSAGKLPKQLGLVNSIDCRNDNELLVGEMSNWRVQKLTLRAAR